MVSISIIPGEGIGDEIFRYVIPFLRRYLPEIQWIELHPQPVSGTDIRRLISENLYHTVSNMMYRGRISQEIGTNILQDPSTAYGRFRRAVVEQVLDDELAAEIWQGISVLLTAQDLRTINRSKACLFGASGVRTGWLLLWMRNAFDLYANVRPIKDCANGLDFVIIRENTEGFYAQIESQTVQYATATGIVSKRSSERIVDFAAHEVIRRATRYRLTMVHKANVLRLTGEMFRSAARQVLQQHPSIHIDELYVDACAYQLIKNPEAFDVIVTTNLFGDILSDEAAGLLGSLGMAGSGNYGNDYALFEPVHGSAPDIAGCNVANPIGTLRSVTMLLHYLALHDRANELDNAVNELIKEKFVTADIGGVQTLSNFVGEIQRRLI